MLHLTCKEVSLEPLNSVYDNLSSKYSEPTILKAAPLTVKILLHHILATQSVEKVFAINFEYFAIRFNTADLLCSECVPSGDVEFYTDADLFDPEPSPSGKVTFKELQHA